MKRWIDKHFTQDQINRVTDIVAEAESHTIGEIVPIIVSRSSAIGHVKWILTALLTIAFVLTETSVGVFHAWAAPVAFLFFYFISIGLAKISWLQRVLTPIADEIKQVHARAELEFYRAQIKKTSRGTGILIFVSVMERRVVVLADEGISAHYPQETWDELVKIMTTEFKQSKVFEGFEKAIRRCGEILQAKLPAAHHDTNELANSLIIKE
jgi:putative membrane protein